MIIGKSNHPVTVKRIEVGVWRLRDEIEAAIEKRIKENSDSETVNIDDLKAFYSGSKDKKTESSENLDASGNPMDDDAMEMLKAMGGGEEEVSEETEEEKMAREMLEGQTSETTETPSVDKEELIKNFTRIPPEIALQSNGFTLLSDINMNEVLIFTNKPFIHGSSIVIELKIPNKFIMSAEVIKCIHISRNSKIISDKRAEYRVHAKFTYPHESERDLLRNFLKSIEPEIPPSPKKVKRPELEDDDDFEDLGL